MTKALDNGLVKKVEIEIRSEAEARVMLELEASIRPKPPLEYNLKLASNYTQKSKCERNYVIKESHFNHRHTHVGIGIN